MKYRFSSKSFHENQHWFRLAGVMAVILNSVMCTALHAADFYWDTNGATAGSGGPTPTGTWDTTGGNTVWSTDSTGSSATAVWSNTGSSTHEARFAAGTDATGSYTVTVGSGAAAPNVYKVFVDEGNVTFSGGTLTFDDTGGFGEGFTVASGSIATISGTAIAKTGAGTTDFFYKNGTGELRIGGAASVTPSVLIASAGALDIVGALQASLLSSKRFVFQGSSNNVIQANGTIINNLGTGAGNIGWLSSGGGFAARGADLNIQLNNGTGTLIWGTTTDFVAAGTAPIFGSTTADDDVRFKNGLDLGGAVRTITVIDNPNSTIDVAWLDNTISNGGITKTGGGTLGLGAANTFTGAITISGGLLYGNTAAINGSDTTNGIFFNNNAILQSGTGGITTGKAVTLTGAGTIDTFGGAITLSGNITGVGVLTKKQANLLTLSGSGNTFSGGLVIDQGTVYVNNANSGVLGSGNVTLGASFSPIVDLNGKSPTIGLLVGAGTNSSVSSSAAGTATLTLAGTGSQSYAGAIQDGGVGNVVALTLSSGTQTLAGNNSYTGATTVNGGTLLLGNNNRIANASDLVLGGGTFATGGFNETLDTLDLNASSTIDFGSVRASSPSATVALSSWSGLLSINNWTGLLSGGGTDRLMLGVGGLTPSQLGQIHFTGYSLAQILGSGEVVPVPEPGTFAMLLFGSVMLWFVRKQRA